MLFIYVIANCFGLHDALDASKELWNVHITILQGI